MKARSLNLVMGHQLKAELPHRQRSSSSIRKESLDTDANQDAVASAGGKPSVWSALISKIKRWITAEPDFETWHRLEFPNEHRHSRNVRDINLHRWY